MSRKELLKAEIDRLDENYLELALNIICQIPHAPPQEKRTNKGEQAAKLMKEIADNGGLGISDPVKWQQDIRKDRKLPFRGN